METNVEDLAQSYMHIEEIASSGKSNFKTRVTEWLLVYRCNCGAIHSEHYNYCDECGGSSIDPIMKRNHLIKSKKFLWWYIYELNFVEFRELDEWDYSKSHING